ncbi:MAG: hypothetical protein RLZZ21_1590 [Planctomycetota bacterium]|jgi:hypothetical protein
MHEGTVSRRSVLSAAAGLLATTVVARAEALPGDAADAPAGVARDSRRIHGWQVFVSQALLATEPRETARALELIAAQLAEIERVVPPPAVAELRKVPLYVMPEYPGVAPRAEYHPDAGWLRDHGRDPAMARGVEFTNVRDFEAEAVRMPSVVLHELAHAYHHRVLPDGFANAEIKAAFDRATAGGGYDAVERRFGNGKPATRERAYALTAVSEYFAETTEAFFGRNDFFPFTRDELRRHDPAMHDLLARLWGVA